MNTRKTHISIIGSKGIPGRYGGFETLTHYLAPSLTKKFSVSVACSKKAYSKNEREKRWKNTNRLFIPLNANGFSGILYDIVSFFILWRKTNIFLILGTSIGFVIPFLKLFSLNKKIIIHPDGLEWERNKWNFLIKQGLKLSTRLAYLFANKIIIDHPALLHHIPKKHHPKTIEIAYGGNHLSKPKEYPLIPKKYWLSIARAEPENTLVTIADTFKEQNDQTWVLISNFTDNNFGKAFKEKYMHYANIVLLDKNYSETDIANYLNNSFGYIHGNSVGGTNPSLVTALFHCERIICHNNKFNKHVTQNKANYYCNEEDLGGIISSKRMDTETYSFSDIGRKEYTWDLITHKYSKLFEQF